MVIIKDKKLTCATIRDLMAMEGEGLLSDESQELIGEHLKCCLDCRLIRQEMGLKVDPGEVGKIYVSDSYPPIPLIQRAVSWLEKLKSVVAVLAVLVILGIYCNNYLQPLVVEERHVSDLAQNQFIVSGKWKDIREEQFHVEGYDYSCSVEELVRTSDFRVILGYGGTQQVLTGVEAMKWLEDWKDPIAINVAVDNYSSALLARTGWLIWHRSDYAFAEVNLAFMPWGERERVGFGSSSIAIHEERDSDYAIPLMLAKGKDRHRTLLPTGISRPGSGWRP